MFEGGGGKRCVCGGGGTGSAYLMVGGNVGPTSTIKLGVYVRG